MVFHSTIAATTTLDGIVDSIRVGNGKICWHLSSPSALPVRCANRATTATTAQLN